MKDLRIGVVGLGYVGLPLALAFAKKFADTVGFDINSEKVQKLKQGIDVNDEGYDEELRATSLTITDKGEALKGCNFFVVGVPTPIDANHNPDLSAVLGACEVVGRAMGKGSTVVFESTVYPGVTDEICAPALERVSGLKRGQDFKLGYSPERMNPGDKEHSLENIIKVVSGEDKETLELVSEVYSSVVRAGVYKASSIKVAEAAKVIENTQRDLNIALMNELSIIFDRLGISTKEVLDAASTKWNFLRFIPGLVGGHCIGVDPYYLTTKAEQVGYHPQVILAGRRINDGMGIFIAQRLVKLLSNNGRPIRGAKVGVLGLTFKENVSDIRNSRVPDIIAELKQFGIDSMVHDPLVEAHAAKEEYGVDVCGWDKLSALDGLILAVPHKVFIEKPLKDIASKVTAGGILIDVKSALSKGDLPSSITYWSL
ncbi:MAG: nucleotide sugar dehydrogenase [Proteobacteria bacterium]|nr:MAG: nucleotide sugar dehydrogenase [Pseudomonadota bacterium]